MKAKDLIKILSEHPEFEIEACYVSEPKQGDKFLNISKFKVDDVADIGYSSKVILLNLE